MTEASLPCPSADLKAPSRDQFDWSPSMEPKRIYQNAKTQQRDKLFKGYWLKKSHFLYTLQFKLNIICFFFLNISERHYLRVWSTPKMILGVHFWIKNMHFYIINCTLNVIGCETETQERGRKKMALLTALIWKRDCRMDDSHICRC